MIHLTARRPDVGQIGFNSAAPLRSSRANDMLPMILDPLIEAIPSARPFPFVAASGLLPPDALAAVTRDFPAIDDPGLFPLSALSYGPAFARLVEELRTPEFAALIGGKLGLDLIELPLMITVRGRCAPRDGRAHTDSKDKVATGLLYLNGPGWSDRGGRLRLLRSRNLSDTIMEVPPVGGSLVAFRRTDASWHGHEPFDGERRYVMFNWVRSAPALGRNLTRHRVSVAFKLMAASLAG